ncbi:uncharacterized protein LOC103569155 [Trichonephila clavipes]|nr:uncharacterized protein LOC103569155 [Trichonephila clavipes]
MDALILPKITSDLPQFQVDASALNTFKHLKLAGVNCLQPSSIDILLGADLFGEIMLNRHLNAPGQSKCNGIHFRMGRFAVKLPFRESSDELGSSRDTAVHCLQQIERRFSKNQSLSDQYHKFMDDYLKLGHMELIPENEIDIPASSSFYLPHHPIPNKNGDKFLLRIVWRNSSFEPIQDFRLTRIAYGTASAPYHAIKCLQQLALNESNNFPLASKAALKDFYVDDLMSGANSLSETLELQNQLTQML